MPTPFTSSRDAAVRRPAAAPLPRPIRVTAVHATPADAALDVALGLLQSGAAGEAIAFVGPALRRAYDTMPADAWRAFGARALDHPCAPLFHEDPFIHRAFAKLRGYPGDAGILDLIYQAVPLPPGTTPLGAELNAHSVHAPACRSVRFRRDLLAGLIDETAARAPGRARVLSLACGHLREAQRSDAVRDGALAAFYALDQDPASIALVGAEHAALGVTPVLASVRDVLARAVRYEGLALAYAAGLYDYLPTPVAVRLTARLFDMLAPGGRLLVGNFCPELRDVGFMEAIMDWHLIYRDEAAMSELAAEVPGARVARQRVFRDPGGDVVYLEIERA